MTPSIGFIGGGRITSIFLSAWEAAGLALGPVAVADTDPAALDRLRAVHPATCITLDPGGPAGQELLFLALHPPALEAALPGLAPRLSRDTLVVSLAPVLDFGALSALLGGHARLARMIPNAPSRFGLGYNPMALGPGVGPRDLERLSGLLQALGACPLVPEGHLEAYAILTAMGPTCFWPQWQVLRELGRAFGLDAPSTDRALAAMLHGAVDLLLERGLSFEETLDLVPGKPLSGAMEGILAPFREQLPAVHARLTAGALRPQGASPRAPRPGAGKGPV